MCEISSGYVNLCEYSVGGIQRLWLGNRSQVATIVQDPLITSPTYSAITDITMTETAVVGVFNVIYEFEFTQDTASASNELVINSPNKYFNHIVSFSIPSYDTAIINLFEQLQISRMFAIVESVRPNGLGENRMFAYGLVSNRGLIAETSTSSLGPTPADASGRVITLSGTGTREARELVPSATHLTLAAFIADLLDNTNS